NQDNTRKAVRFSVTNLGTYQFKSPTVALGETGSANVGIYAADLDADNVQATVSGSALTPVTPIYWAVGQADDTETQFIARYPYAAGAGITDAYEIPSDQSSEDTFTYQENFMSAVATSTPATDAVNFAFKHPFAKVQVNITNNLGADAAASLVMKQVKMNATALNLATAPATPTLADTKVNVVAYKVSATRFELVIMPQAATAEMDIVVTTTLGSIYTFRISGEYTFVAGKVAVAAVTLDPVEGIDSSRDEVGALSFSDPEEWTNGVATTITETADPVAGNYYQVGGCLYATADKGADAWDKYYNMQYTAENTWTITINYDEAMTDDESGKGFIIRRGENYWGMWTGSEHIDNEYVLEPTDDTHKNIKLAAAGNYTLVYNSSSRIFTTITRNGDAE
ncbi:MAG: fimbrillin family protein, partial [Bacteroidales bacterium]|nr:fimbrillin family protein [Bacteroidales bacterium]